MNKQLEQQLTEAVTTMDVLKQEKARLEFELKNIDSQIDRQRLFLENVLSNLGIDNMQFKGFTFGWKTIKSNRFNQKLFAEDYPQLLEQYKKEVVNSRFEFKVGI